MLPNWSLHLNETHGVTADWVLRTQNICLFVELDETKLFSFVNVNSKNHMCVPALRWPFRLIWFHCCHGTPAIWFCFFLSLLIQMRQTAWGLPRFISTSRLSLTLVFLPGIPSLFRSPNPVVSYSGRQAPSPA